MRKSLEHPLGYFKIIIGLKQSEIFSRNFELVLDRLQHIKLKLNNLCELDYCFMFYVKKLMTAMSRRVWFPTE